MPYMLIGGFDVDEPHGNIKKFLIEKTKVKTPTILYISLANKGKDSIVSKFLEEYKDCKVKNIDLLKKISKKALLCDIIESHIVYIDGGSTPYLYRYIIEHDLSYIFSYAESLGKIIAGVSAGAIIQCKYGMGDTYSFKDSDGHSYNFKMVKGLSLLNITVCPHFNKPDLIDYIDVLKRYEINSLAIENSTAVYIEDNSLEVIKNKNFRSVYYFKAPEYKMRSIYPNKKYKVEVKNV